MVLTVNETAMTLCRDWDYRDCRFWFWSEKLDGCRGYWDGFRMWTRDGNAVKLPNWFTLALPNGVALDGEIYCGRGKLIDSMRATRWGRFSKSVQFHLFDAPDRVGDWMERMTFADKFCNDVVRTGKRGVITERDEPSNLAAEIIAGGGEGLILRSPFVTTYERRRTINCCRIKARNLYAPWHGAKPRLKLRDFGGLRMSEWPFDPEMEYKILHQ